MGFSLVFYVSLELCDLRAENTSDFYSSLKTSDNLPIIHALPACALPPPTLPNFHAAAGSLTSCNLALHPKKLPTSHLGDARVVQGWSRTRLNKTTTSNMLPTKPVLRLYSTNFQTLEIFRLLY